MINLKKLLKPISLSLLLLGTQLVSPVYNQVAHAATNDLIQQEPKIYAFNDEEELKAKIFNDPNFIKKYATLGDRLGFGWCGGTRSQYVGEDFDFYKSGDSYVLKGHYDPNDPLCRWI
ncbi:aerolysin family beta-barrel pore-forming toxin [Clostridium sp. Marseille-Q2269]|uniref:aerolysin family beta-barrel pore-forming toxin n=1 Tax=Clostridium sp. Marseille-Q2269 TaxID=2942205 RepID=UPI0020734CF3|nr:aerolysin family beta-barrel pore-forming toxin [Clostridium sp. Marseille-Q2269]